MLSVYCVLRSGVGDGDGEIEFGASIRNFVWTSKLNSALFIGEDFAWKIDNYGLDYFKDCMYLCGCVSLNYRLRIK